MLASSLDAVAERVAPIDQCASDPEFAAFRNDLQRAVTGRNVNALLRLVDEGVEVDLGGGSGHDDFVRAWRLDRPADSPLWRELGEVLSLGCAREAEDVFWAPSFYIQFDELDDAEFDAVTMQGGALHAAPDAQSAVVATLDWNRAAIDADDGSAEWLRIRLVDGRSGFVRRHDIRRVTDYRAEFERIDDRWVLVSFHAGD